MLNAFKVDYNINDTIQLNKFTNGPVNKVKEIVQGHYPILILCADEDEAVFAAENTLLFKRNVKALNGSISVIHKPGFKHHPHSLPNPAPIVDFILKATGYYNNITPVE